MAEFELNIYGNDDEILKTYATNFIRWGVFMQAVELKEKIKTQNTVEQFNCINKFMKKIFPDLSDDDLEKADSGDVINSFNQLLNKANGIGAGSKNETGAAE